MRAKTFLEIHHALLNGEPLDYGKGEAEKLFNGLCGFWIGTQRLSQHEIFRLFIPTDNEIESFGMDHAWWCDSESYCSDGEGGDTYNDLRQNIILLCAAINGEL